MSDQPKTPEEFWKKLLATDPDYAYELLVCAPKLAKWKKTRTDVDYLDHVRVETRTIIREEFTYPTRPEAAVRSKNNGYTIINE